MTFSDNYSHNRYPYFEQYPKQSSYTHSNNIQQPAPVKVEVNDSPDLHAPPYHYHPQSLAQFSQKSSLPVFRFGDPSSSHISTSSPSTPSTSFSFMSSHPWPPSASTAASGSSFQPQHHHHHQQYTSERMHVYPVSSSLNGHSHTHPPTMPISDDYDDADDDGLADLPPGIGVGIGGYSPNYAASEAQGGSKASEKAVRRRSSKACDQCRKSKCKCERTNAQDPCRNCVMLGTGASHSF